MKTTRLPVVLLALVTGAFAQENPAKLALAREVITAMKADQMMDGMMAQMKQMAAQMADSAMPAEAQPELRRKAAEFQGRLMDLSMESAKDLIAQMDRVYAEVYSEPELQAMLAFFNSPEGRSMLAKQPQVMQRVLPLVQSMQRDLMPRIRQLTDQMKAELQAAKAAAGAAGPKTP